MVFIRERRSLGFCGGPCGPVPTGVTVTPANATADAGATKQFSAKVDPAEADQAVTWSSDQALVTIDANGLATVSAEAVGGEVANITATAKNGVTGTAKLTVNTPSAQSSGK